MWNQTRLSDNRTTLLTNHDLLNVVQNLNMNMVEKGTCTSFMYPPELQLNCKRGFDEAVMKYFCKRSFKDFEN